MKIGFVSLGCSKNLVDSEKMMGMLSNGNHEFVHDPSVAEAIIINTCGFINSAKEEAIETIFEMSNYKKTGKCKKLIVVGCLAQRYKEQLLHDMPEIDAVISIKEYPQIHEIFAQLINDETLTSYAKSERLISSKPWTAYLKIAEGCSNCCTYCAIPLIRGKNLSFPIENIVDEAKELAKNGVKELVLIAQDTTKYGIDLYGKQSLLKLLQEIHKIEGFHWIRILYMYPDEIDDELLLGISKLEKVVPYFDIPLQHINNDLLKAMNRRGNNQEVRALLNKIRKIESNAILRTTFIVGFPGETKEQFQELLEFVKDTKWDRVGAFTYSPEEDTKAFYMEQTVSEEEKLLRLQQLMKLQEEISYEKHKDKINQVIEVLVEEQEGLSGKYRGRSMSSAPDGVDGLVIFKSERAIPFGSFVKVKITEAQIHDLIGEEVAI